jgi:hypothetical protein
VLVALLWHRRRFQQASGGSLGRSGDAAADHDRGPRRSAVTRRDRRSTTQSGPLTRASGLGRCRRTDCPASVRQRPDPGTRSEEGRDCRLGRPQLSSPRTISRSVLAAVGFNGHLVGRGGQQAGLPFGLRREDLRCPLSG